MKKSKNEIALEKIRESSNLGYRCAIKYLDFLSQYENVTKSGIKMAIIGSYCSGKTTFINKLKDKYDFSYTKVTIGFNYFALMCKNDDDETFLVDDIDTSGTERYHRIVKKSLREANLTIIMYEIDNPSSFEEIDYWIATLREVNDNSKLLFVGNKIDLERNVLKTTAAEKAEEYNAPYIEVSALYGDGIDICYHKICYILNKLRVRKNTPELRTVNINEANNNNTGMFGWLKNLC